MTTDTLFLKFEKDVAAPRVINGGRGFSKYAPLSDAILTAPREIWLRFLFVDGKAAQNAAGHVAKMNVDGRFNGHACKKRVVAADGGQAWLYVRLDKKI